MANVQIKSEKLTPFGGIFPIMEQFDALLAQTIDSTLGMRCKWYGYQYSEILRSLMCQLSYAKLLKKIIQLQILDKKILDSVKNVGKAVCLLVFFLVLVSIVLAHLD